MTLILALCAGCGATPSFPYDHPDTERALIGNVSVQRMEQRAEQLRELGPRAPRSDGADRAADLQARQLYAHGLFVSVLDGAPRHTSPGDAQVRPPRTVLASLPPADVGRDGILFFFSEGRADGRGEALLMEIACAWTTTIRAGRLARPPFELRFAIFPGRRSRQVYLEELERRGEYLLASLDCDDLSTENGELRARLDSVVSELAEGEEATAIRSDLASSARVALAGTLRFLAALD